MQKYQLSRLARSDLLAIADYTVDRWGMQQANLYIEGLFKCFEQISATPALGRPCDQVRRGYRRLEHRKHVIFYRADTNSVFINRILHQRMLPGPQVFEDY